MADELAQRDVQAIVLRRTPEQMRARIEAARTRLLTSTEGLKRSLDVLESVRRHPWRWVLGALAVGAVVGALGRRR